MAATPTGLERLSGVARDIAERLALQPHPEGGYYRQSYRADLEIRHPGVAECAGAARPASTAIYFLLAADDYSAFHRVRCSDELWHLYAGAALELHLIHADGRHEQRLLSSDLRRGEPVAVVEAGCWQAARLAPGGEWMLCGCTVSPGFSFADFEMPAAQALIDAYPQHAGIIRELTRP